MNQLLLQPLPKTEQWDRQRWAIVGGFTYESKIAGRLAVPDGFVCDLTSMPRFLWWASTPSEYPEAAVVHDWGYRGNLPRDVADRVYAEILTELCMPPHRVALRYMALRLFGGFSYKG